MKSIHNVITFMSQFDKVSNPSELAKFVLDNRHTPLFKVQAVKQFDYGIVDPELEGSIKLYTFEDPNNSSFAFFTFGLKLKDEEIEDTSLVVILGLEGFTVMTKKDAKEMFEFIEDEKVKKTDEELLLKTIEVYSK